MTLRWGGATWRTDGRPHSDRRLQFTLTVTFRYLFPILTMGLALFIAYMKSVAYLGRRGRRVRLLR